MLGTGLSGLHLLSDIDPIMSSAIGESVTGVCLLSREGDDWPTIHRTKWKSQDSHLGLTPRPRFLLWG